VTDALTMVFKRETLVDSRTTWGDAETIHSLMEALSLIGFFVVKVAAKECKNNPDAQ
jgi:hypothetical protein